MARVEMCVCGGRIRVAAGAEPGPAVLAHGRSPGHVAWRLGFRARDVDTRLPCPDGRPVMVLDR